MPRYTYLDLTQNQILQDWASNVSEMFHGEVSYHVGSSTERPDYRDVDVRMILHDKDYDRLAKRLQIWRLSMTVSLWGQQVTGLPIDFQIQRMTEANEENPGKFRNPFLHTWDDTKPKPD